jgi:hypothetical protein
VCRERGCVGSPFLPPFVLDTSGTVELSTLGLPTVASFLCTSDVDLINLCFSNTTLGCFQALTKTDGCSNLPQFSSDLTFGSVFLTTPGTECTLFQWVPLFLIGIPSDSFALQRLRLRWRFRSLCERFGYHSRELFGPEQRRVLLLRLRELEIRSAVAYTHVSVFVQSLINIPPADICLHPILYLLETFEPLTFLDGL